MHNFVGRYGLFMCLSKVSTALLVVLTLKHFAFGNLIKPA